MRYQINYEHNKARRGEQMIISFDWIYLQGIWLDTKMHHVQIGYIFVIYIQSPLWIWYPWRVFGILNFWPIFCNFSSVIFFHYTSNQ